MSSAVADAPSAEKELTAPVAPNDSEVRAQTRQLSLAIERYAKRIEEIKQLTAGRKELSAEELRLVNEVRSKRGHFEAALREKQGLREELNRVNEKREALRNKARQIKANAETSSLEEIESQIRKYEDKVNKVELTEKEQQQCIAAIQTLVRSRENLRNLQEQLDVLQEDDGGHGEPVERLKKIDAELDRRKAEEKKAMDDLEAFKKRKKDELNIDELNAEKQECWEVLCALRAKKQEIDKEFRQRMNTYKREKATYERAKTRQQNEKRKMERRVPEEKEGGQETHAKPVVKEFRRPARRPVNRAPPPSQSNEKSAERKKAEQQQRALHQRKQQLQLKIAKCDDLLSFLKPYLSSLKEPERVDVPQTETQSYEAEETGASVASLGPGMKQLKKKESEDCDAWLQGTKQKKTKRKKPKKSVKVERPEDKILMYSLDICQVFNSLEVPAPNTLADVPRAIERLEKLKTDLQAKKDGSDEKAKPPVEHNDQLKEVPSTEQAVDETDQSEPLAGVGSDNKGMSEEIYPAETKEVPPGTEKPDDVDESNADVQITKPKVASLQDLYDKLEQEAKSLTSAQNGTPSSGTKVEDGSTEIAYEETPAVDAECTRDVSIPENRTPMTEEVEGEQQHVAEDLPASEPNATPTEKTTAEAELQSPLAQAEVKSTSCKDESDDSTHQSPFSETTTNKQMALAPATEKVKDGLDDVYISQQPLPEKLSLTELSKSQLPATLEDLDPLESVTMESSSPTEDAASTAVSQQHSAFLSSKLDGNPVVRLLLEVLSETCIQVHLKIESTSLF